MPAILEAESTLTDRYQTTVPEIVRRALRLDKRDTIRPSGEATISPACVTGAILLAPWQRKPAWSTAANSGSSAMASRSVRGRMWISSILLLGNHDPWPWTHPGFFAFRGGSTPRG